MPDTRPRRERLAVAAYRTNLRRHPPPIVPVIFPRELLAITVMCFQCGATLLNVVLERQVADVVAQRFVGRRHAWPQGASLEGGVCADPTKMCWPSRRASWI